MTAQLLQIGAHTVHVTRPDKILFPGERPLTKWDLVEYYRRIAGTMLPYVEGRPVTMQRFPDGIEGEGFFQQDVPAYFPRWVARAMVAKEAGRVTHVLCQNAATLVYLADQACITPHVWLSRVDKPAHPDRLIFDLDPPDDDFGPVRTAARLVRTLLGELGLSTYLMTTGSRGVHVVAPLDRTAVFDQVRAFVREAAVLLTHRHPRELTVEARVAQRAGRLFLDTGRNAYAQTAVAPYAVRAKPGAPVATPLAWDELEDQTLTARTYRLDNMFERLEQTGDLWRGMARQATSPTEARRQLADLLKSEGATFGG
ncbi:MAG TPA: non-homologous end-joining DNA ligase [Gemmatimonadales bacterium]|nr:non-homologous end-joining DNA ligase [Gemmatimonadales bacterium]